MFALYLGLGIGVVQSQGDVIYILLRVRDMTYRMEQLQQDVRSLTGAPGSIDNRLG